MARRFPLPLVLQYSPAEAGEEDTPVETEEGDLGLQAEPLEKQIQPAQRWKDAGHNRRGSQPYQKVAINFVGEVPEMVESCRMLVAYRKIVTGTGMGLEGPVTGNGMGMPGVYGLVSLAGAILDSE